MSHLILTPPAKFKSFKSQLYLSSLYIMDRKRKNNQSSTKKCKIDTYNKRMVEMIKSIEQWVADIVKREK